MSTVSRTLSYRHHAGPYVGHTSAMNLTYDDTNPFTVDVDFGPDESHWEIWRDILARRSDGKAVCVIDNGMCEGGASCEVDGVWAYLTLAGQAGTVTFRFVAADLDAFLRKTEALVPYGSEVIDIDAGLMQLLGGER